MSLLQTSSQTVPVCVDLDRTLIASDLLVESLFVAARHRPRLLFTALSAGLRRGRAALKHVLADDCPLDVATLPYRAQVLAFLREQHNAGRQLVLSTAADQALARRVAAHLGLFDHVLASDGTVNLKGETKLQAIREVCPEGYDYVGDSDADRPLWQHARCAYLVAPRPRTLRWAQKTCAQTEVICPEPSRLISVFRLLRPHQWVKNVLLLLPLAMSHDLDNIPLLVAALLAFAAFCLGASGVYVINDALDVEVDRLHPTKRLRPFASGAVPLHWAPLIVLVLFAGSAALCALTPPRVALCLAIYIVASLAYSSWLKREPLVDVLTLAGLYTLRLIAGAGAVNVPISPWLANLSVFLFASLAFAKRHAELVGRGLEQSKPLPGRGYRGCDLRVILSLGPGCGLVAVLVFAQYINSGMVRQLYQRPKLLWIICPVLLYWIARVWFLANRGELDEDPVVFAVKDKISWLALAVTVAVALAAAPIDLA
jgi:4-hydroxybenzoate polyprenyltransferase/phosphoserine phosphatase